MTKTKEATTPNKTPHVMKCLRRHRLRSLKILKNLNPNLPHYVLRASQTFLRIQLHTSLMKATPTPLLRLAQHQ